MDVLRLCLSLVTMLCCAHAQTLNLMHLAKSLGLTTLVTQLKEQGLDEVISGPGPFTLMAPTNEAFAEIPESILSNNTALTEILKFHVAEGEIESADVKDEQKLHTLNHGSYIRFNKYMHANMITGMGSPITMPDKLAINGILHVISSVMTPPRLNLVEFLETKPSLTSLHHAATSAGIAGALAADPLTVFGPDNHAFHKANSISNTTALATVLQYHTVADTLFSTGLENGQVLQTSVPGAYITVAIQKAVYLNDAKVIAADAGPILNGAIHIIDKVLTPPSGTVIDLISNDERLTKLFSAVKAAGLVETLAGDGPFTVFAPSNSAFNKIDSSHQILSDHDEMLAILRYHVSPMRIYSVGLNNGQHLPTLEASKDITIAIAGGVTSFIPGMGSPARTNIADITVYNGVVHIIDTVLIPSVKPPDNACTSTSASAIFIVVITTLLTFL